MLAVSYSATTRIVTVNGTVFGDTVTLSRGVGNLLVVNENGGETSFALADVDHVNVTLTGDAGNDLVTVNPLFSGSRALTVTVNTGNGSDTFRARAAGAGSAFTLWDVTTSWTFPGVGTFAVNHFNTELSEAYGSDTAADSFTTARIAEPNPNVVVSAYGFGGNDTMTIGQDVINSTVGANVLFTGGAGTDSMLVDASANVDPTSLRVINFRVQMSGSLRQAQFFETENVTLTGGSGGDSIAVDSFHNGAHLTVNGGGGDDIVDFTPLTRDLATHIVNIASFNYDGGEGSDVFRVYNDNSTQAWNYFRTTGGYRAQATTVTYELQLNCTNTEDVYGSGGSGNDQFFIDSSPAGSTTQVDGMGGEADFYYFGNPFTRNTSQILGSVQVWDPGPGLDGIFVDNRFDPIGRTVHVSEGSIGAGPGDDLFGPGASVSYFGIPGVVDLHMGSGDDTVFARESSSSLNLLGYDPSSAPGDTLNLAMATATNPVHSPSTPGDGFVNYADGPGLSYVSFEQVNFDTIAPGALDIVLDPTFGAQALSFAFNDDVSASLNSFSLALNNDTAFTPIDPADITYAFAGNVATFTFPGLGGTLADGDYTLMLVGATDAVGNAAVGDNDYRFIWDSGDAGGDTIADVYRVAVNPVTFRTEVLYGGFEPQLLYHADPFLLDMVALHGGVNDDVLHVDGAIGQPIPADGIHFQGSPGDADRIVMHGKAAFADDTAFDAGTIEQNGQAVMFSDVEAFSYDGAGGQDLLSVAAGNVEVFATQQLQGLTIETGASLRMASGLETVLVTRALTINSGGYLDLANNDLVFDYDDASPIGSWDGLAYTGLAGMIASGREIFSGIISSISVLDDTMLGIAEAADVLGLGPGDTGEFSGQAVDATSVLIKFTYGGDANLDGIVSGDDYSSIDFNVAVPGASGWYNGDFNYDGIISGDDYSVIDFMIAAQGAPL